MLVEYLKYGWELTSFWRKIWVITYLGVLVLASESYYKLNNMTALCLSITIIVWYVLYEFEAFNNRITKNLLNKIVTAAIEE